jgi:hypothetical protein
MGLAIVQVQYDRQTNASTTVATPSSPDEPEKKKRKMNPLKSIVPGFMTSSGDDDDLFGTNKKAKAGIGYAGTIKEDVSTPFFK